MGELYQGKITRGVGGFYYVFVPLKDQMYECRAKGSFRNDNIRPLVGDDVEIQIISQESATGNIDRILPRKSALVRPAVANVDQAMVIFSVKKPDLSLNLLDRMLIHIMQQNLPAFLCLNKADLDENGMGRQIAAAYEAAGYPVYCISALKDADVERVRVRLMGKTTTVAGPSGVGKSTLINRLQHSTQMETGEVSKKLSRGKHTTRHSQLIPVDQNSYILDTPGFGSLELFDLEKEDLAACYSEFTPYAGECKFTGCTHTHEPVCGVKDALAQGKISKIRYETYRTLYEELAGRQRKYDKERSYI
ncbi:MAG: ribosome small subunit-dependent GTPase A [Lachnospiraceae bacterium]|nr:ribosome small subunit-dependent GTPase A [Lachnospiraceae bacterium]